MGKRWFLTAVLLGLAMAFGALGGGCKSGSGDKSLTVQEYFQQLDTAENAFRAADATVVAQIEALYTEENAATAAAKAPGLLERAQVNADEFVAALQGLEPPDEVAAAHDELIAGFQTLSRLAGQAIPEFEGAQTLDSLNAFFQDPEMMSTQESLNGACAALHSIAQTNGIEVDLGCS